jgi:putative two-component system response regulator
MKEQRQREGEAEFVLKNIDTWVIKTTMSAEKKRVKKSGMHILVVDDEEIIIALLTRALTNAGFCVSSAKDGKAALEVLRDAGQGHFAALLTDIQMPKLRGDSLQRIVREIDPHLAVMLVTALDDTDLAVACMREGAADYVIKPFVIEDVIARLHNVLEKRQKCSLPSTC